MTWSAPRILVAAIAAATISLGASAQAPGATAERRVALLGALRPVSDQMLLHPGDDDWLMWRRTYDGWGYSPLDQIDRGNVGALRLVWSWSLTNGASETTPLVHDGVLFVHNNGDKIDALDAATGDLLWEYNRKLSPELLAGNSIWLTKRATWRSTGTG